MNNYDFLSVIDEKKDWLDGIADYLWENPELAFRERKSAECLMNALRREGFDVSTGLAGIETAFSGRFGSGKPVIGILGEFDALDGLCQSADAVQPDENGARTPGHGCGHNLLGTGSLAAAIAVKRYLEENPGSGTVVYFGCPGEEGGSGKAFMARDGVFDELDAALCWHPDVTVSVRTHLTLANDQVMFKFDGKPSHAGGAPELGRSALDAVELMNVGVNFLREHMIDEARIHYAIIDTGGASPNVVQGHAEVLYLIRAPKADQVEALYQRVLKIAQGAALMTETKESHEFIKGCSNVVPNEPIQRMLQEKMEQIAPPKPSEEDVEYCRRLTAQALSQAPTADMENPIHWELQPYAPEIQKKGSTDVGDVSWVCPTAQISAATWAMGTPAHSWQVVAQGKRRLAHEMTRYVGKILAAGAVELLKDPELLRKAKEDHRARVGETGYVPPIPKDVHYTAVLSALRKK